MGRCERLGVRWTCSWDAERTVLAGDCRRVFAGDDSAVSRALLVFVCIGYVDIRSVVSRLSGQPAPWPELHAGVVRFALVFAGCGNARRHLLLAALPFHRGHDLCARLTFSRWEAHYRSGTKGKIS